MEGAEPPLPPGARPPVPGGPPPPAELHETETETTTGTNVRKAKTAARVEAPNDEPSGERRLPCMNNMISLTW